MMPLLVFRERVKNFYQRYDIYINPVVKFIFALITFIAINNEIGYDTRFKSIPVVLAMSLLSAFTPSAVMVLLAALVSVLHIYSASPIISIMVILILLIIYLLFARFTPKLGYVILAIPILYFLKIPYLVPLLLGIVSTPIAIIPTACGVFVYYLFQIVKTAISMQVNTSAMEDILSIYIYIIDELIGNKQMIMSIVIFALIILVVYYVRRMKFDYSFEISIAAGALTSILGFLISDLILDKSDQILSMILGTIVSAAIVFVINFFKITLDYSGVEMVQFEDDVYYYYVKAVPKITVTTPQMKVKHINVKNISHNVGKSGFSRREEDSDEEYDEDEAYLNNNDDNKDRNH